MIHGTFYRNWDIIKINGLSRMRRNHVHFAVGLPSSKEVISGMRNFCEVYIYLNVNLALKDGIKLYKSSNGVILSPGNQEGVIESKYFLKVVDAKTGKFLINLKKCVLFLYLKCILHRACSFLITRNDNLIRTVYFLAINFFKYCM